MIPRNEGGGLQKYAADGTAHVRIASIDGSLYPIPPRVDTLYSSATASTNGVLGGLGGYYNYELTVVGVAAGDPATISFSDDGVSFNSVGMYNLSNDTFYAAGTALTVPGIYVPCSVNGSNPPQRLISYSAEYVKGARGASSGATVSITLRADPK